MRLSAWLNAARRGDVSEADALHVCAHIIGLHDGSRGDQVTQRDWLDMVTAAPWFRPALPEPGDPWGVPIMDATEAVALGPNVLLVRTDAWRAVTMAHTVPVIDTAWARRALLDAVAQAGDVLQPLATVGDRSRAEAALATSDSPWPPLPERVRADLELARGILTMASVAGHLATVPSSRSQERTLTDTVRSLVHASRVLLCAAAGTETVAR